MRCVRLSWRINHDFTLRWSGLASVKKKKKSPMRDRQREKDRGIEKNKIGA